MVPRLHRMLVPPRHIKTIKRDMVSADMAERMDEHLFFGGDVDIAYISEITPDWSTVLATPTIKQVNVVSLETACKMPRMLEMEKQMQHRSKHPLALIIRGADGTRVSFRHGDYSLGFKLTRYLPYEVQEDSDLIDTPPIDMRLLCERMFCVLSALEMYNNPDLKAMGFEPPYIRRRSPQRALAYRDTVMQAVLQLITLQSFIETAEKYEQKRRLAGARHRLWVKLDIFLQQ